jgi:restriction endonuclease S subunit
MGNKYITDTKIKLSDAGSVQMGKRREIEKDMLLMSFKLTLGKTAFAGCSLFTNEAICALVLKDKYNTKEIKEYLYHILPLVDYIPYAQRAAKGFTLNKDLIPTVEIPFPDQKERQQIVKKKENLELQKKTLEDAIKENISDYDKFIATNILQYQ